MSAFVWDTLPTAHVSTMLGSMLDSVKHAFAACTASCVGVNLCVCVCVCVCVWVVRGTEKGSTGEVGGGRWAVGAVTWAVKE